MVDDTQLAVSRSIHKRTGKTFYYATKLLPQRVRHATYVLYAFFRVADEVVDDPDGLTPAEQRDRLDELESAALGRAEPDDPVVAAFRERFDAQVQPGTIEPAPDARGDESQQQ